MSARLRPESASGPAPAGSVHRGSAGGRAGGLWRAVDPALVAVAVVALAAGFAQFAAAATLGDVARTFGHLAGTATIRDEAGLSGTQLGIGLAVLRLSSLGGLPLAGSADRFGRRPVLLSTIAAGLVLTVLAAPSPSYWWLVIICAAGRSPLTAAGSVAQVVAAEQSSAGHRATGMALVAGAYGVGAGAVAVLHSTLAGAAGFRAIFAMALVPLILVALVRRRIAEPTRFTAVAPAERSLPVVGAVGRRYRRRLAVVAGLAFLVAVVTGPANSFLFLYAQNVRHLPGWITALMVAGAGLAGLGGLIAGRWLADHVGRRLTCAVGMTLIALSGLAAYSGSRSALVGGYVAGIASGSVLAPAAGSLANELFPTPVRASVAGWYAVAGVVGATVGLLSFGVLADVGNRFGVAAAATFLPVIPGALLLLLVPETKGREPETMWPDSHP